MDVSLTKPQQKDLLKLYATYLATKKDFEGGMPRRLRTGRALAAKGLVDEDVAGLWRLTKKGREVAHKETGIINLLDEKWEVR